MHRGRRTARPLIYSPECFCQFASKHWNRDIISPAERSHSIVSLTKRTRRCGSFLRPIIPSRRSTLKFGTSAYIRKCEPGLARFTSTANIEATQTDVRFVPMADIEARSASPDLGVFATSHRGLVPRPIHTTSMKFVLAAGVTMPNTHVDAMSHAPNATLIHCCCQPRKMGDCDQLGPKMIRAPSSTAFFTARASLDEKRAHGDKCSQMPSSHDTQSVHY